MNDYEYFLSTLPDNLKNSGDGYNMYRYWELNGRPKDFEEARQIEMFRLFEDGYHAPTIAWNQDTGIGEFMKPKDHPSVWREVDYYNNGRYLDEKWWVPKDRDVTYDTLMNYNIYQLDPEFDSDEYRDWENLRNNYNLIEKNNTYYYEPKTVRKRRTDLEEGLAKEYKYLYDEYPVRVYQDPNYNSGIDSHIEYIRGYPEWQPGLEFPKVDYNNGHVVYSPAPFSDVIVFDNTVKDPQTAVNLDYLHQLEERDPEFQKLLNELKQAELEQMKKSDEADDPKIFAYLMDQALDDMNLNPGVVNKERALSNRITAWLRGMLHPGKTPETRDGYPMVQDELELAPYLYEPTRNIINYLYPIELPEVIVKKQGGKLIPRKRYIK